ncbi:MAG: DEAD/DEAH box helicase family protein [Bacteroidaceae bacterium]
MTNKNELSLELAKRLTEKVNEAWADGSMLEAVKPTTAELLKWWFSEEQCTIRERNFHEGQRQAILNIVYLHEVAKVNTVADIYACAGDDLIAQADQSILAKAKYRIPKYAVKMATGTGKTWVMHAVLLWQMLNARHEDEPSGRFTRNFLIVAPGLIVYDRLLDAFCGRIRRGTEYRDFYTNDFVLNQDLFIPTHLRQEVFSFLQNNVVTKEEGIGRKTTGDGLVALTNWHLFENQLDDEEPQADGELDAAQIIGRLFPIRPGKAAGNDLGMLDRRSIRGSEIEYLNGLKDIMVINDEAHHIHELKRGGEIEEVEWQKGLNAIAEGKGHRFFQIDFSATPYDTHGSGKNRQECYFPHIVVDFDLASAMRKGLVKTLLLDRRQELTELEHLDYKAERDARKRVIGLSDGQRLMIRAGLAKLAKLEKDFTAIDENKNPKMLILCEDTSVSPFVEQFVLDEGLAKDDVVTVDSNQKGEVSEEEWKELKTRLFDIDKYRQPKVIVSVLMLREGFDVNNICVIVPLRPSEAPILLEQIIGRGLRLMWREDEYKSTKDDDRRRVLQWHTRPETYLDMLSIIEHPAFIHFYENLFKQGLAVEENEDLSGGITTGDLLNVGLKENYEKYDFQWPIILRDAEEELDDYSIDVSSLAPFTHFPLETLRRFLAKEGEVFLSQEVTTKTQFGKYVVTGNLFEAKSYNEYLQKILHTITLRFDRISSHKEIRVPTIQIDDAQIIATVDVYIRTHLFGCRFNPFEGNDWKILLAKDGAVTTHIINEMARAVCRMQEELLTTDARVEHRLFSEVKALKMRESFSLPLQKTIYERTQYPSHGGGLEKAFAEFLDRDAEVERFLKISETRHDFASIYYIRTDGLLAVYHPDFLVATGEKVYLVETKGNDKINDRNVRQKQTATIEWTRKINTLKPEERMNREWEYVLLSEDTFYGLSANGASITDICNLNRVSLSQVTGDLFSESTGI